VVRSTPLLFGSRQLPGGAMALAPSTSKSTNIRPHANIRARMRGVGLRGSRYRRNVYHPDEGGGAKASMRNVSHPDEGGGARTSMRNIYSPSRRGWWGKNEHEKYSSSRRGWWGKNEHEKCKPSDGTRVGDGGVGMGQSSSTQGTKGTCVNRQAGLCTRSVLAGDAKASFV